MRSIILCEGNNDCFFLGYYLYKTLNYNFNKNTSLFSDNYYYPKRQNEKLELYINEKDDMVLIWAVHGCDAFSKPIYDILHIYKEIPIDYVDNIFIIKDRDDNEEKDLIVEFNTIFSNELNTNINLINNTKNELVFDIDGQALKLNIIPIIIPLDENGAMETILLNAMAKNNENEKMLIEKSQIFVNSFDQSIYLKKRREKLKAVFSTTFSIINPCHSTCIYNDLFLQYNWEKNPHVTNHLGILNRLL